MDIDGIPKSILDKHPELVAIHQALDEYRHGRDVTARCPKCNEPLVVKDVPATGELWVTCRSGCTQYRERSAKPAEPGSGTHRFYTVNDRPVLFVPTDAGGMDVQALDMRTGQFARDMKYLSQVLDPFKDVEELSEDEFNRRVDAIRREIASRADSTRTR